MARLDSITVPISKKLKHWLRESARQDGRTLAAYARHILDTYMRQGGSHERSVETDGRKDHES